jgi:hypothetical protein
VLQQETIGRQGAHDAEHAVLGQPKAFGDLGDRTALRLGAQVLQDLQRPVQVGDDVGGLLARRRQGIPPDSGRGPHQRAPARIIQHLLVQHSLT